MARDSLGRRFAPTIPADLNDPTRFGQVVEQTKDVLVEELRKFLDNAEISDRLREEIPTIEKFAKFENTADSYTTAATVVQALSDRGESLPHVVVLSSGGKDEKWTIGTPAIAQVHEAPRIVLPDGPYALEDGDWATFRLQLANGAWIDETIEFVASRFPVATPITLATPAVLRRVINEQTARLRAIVVNSHIEIKAGGFLEDRTPRFIMLLDGSTNLLTVFAGYVSGNVTNITRLSSIAGQFTTPAGTLDSSCVNKKILLEGATNARNEGYFTVTAFSSALGEDTITFESRMVPEELGSPATFTLRSQDHFLNYTPKNRYIQGAQRTIQLLVLTDDDNTRTELFDLIWTWATFTLEEKYFTFHGRSGFEGQTVQNETFQICIVPPVTDGGLSEVPRPGDGTGKIHIGTISLNLILTRYIDRDVFFPGTDTPFIVQPGTLVFNDTLPLGSTREVDDYL